MVKWEYRKFHVGRCDSVPPVSAVDRALDEIGQEGWELVCSVGEWLFFKRPIEPSLEEQHEMMRMCCERKDNDSED